MHLEIRCEMNKCWPVWLGLCLTLVGAALAQEAWQQAHEAGVKAAKEARFAAAEKLLSQSIRQTRSSGTINALLARSLLDLAEVYRTEGKYAQAQPCYEEALQIDQQQYGADSLQAAEVLDRHAELYKTLSDYAHAEPMLLRALEIRQRKLPPEHAAIAQVQNDLGSSTQPREPTTKPGRSSSLR
jgi:tetratricopeptide (TPR) repeat protein